LLHTLQPGNLLKDYDKLNQMLNVRSFGVMKQLPIMPAPQVSSGNVPPHSMAVASSGSRGVAGIEINYFNYAKRICFADFAT
jgi:hypothetical protein